MFDAISRADDVGESAGRKHSGRLDWVVVEDG